MLFQPFATRLVVVIACCWSYNIAIPAFCYKLSGSYSVLLVLQHSDISSVIPTFCYTLSGSYITYCWSYNIAVCDSVCVCARARVCVCVQLS